MKSPFFSIIIPVFNGEATIENCFNSIVFQDFTDYEVLIVDNCSSDKTQDISSRYHVTHPEFKLHVVKSGIYEAMNYGIKESTGQYLYFMGCDDVLFGKQALSDIAAAIRTNNSPHIIYGNALMGKGNRLHDGSFNLSKLYHWNICHQSIFYARAVFDIIGFFDPSYPVHADWHFNFRCFANRHLKIAYAPLLVSVYAADGFSSRNQDSLESNRKTIFLSIAKGADAKEYFRLKLDTVEAAGLTGRIKYLYYVALFGVALVLQKALK